VAHQQRTLEDAGQAIDLALGMTEGGFVDHGLTCNNSFEAAGDSRAKRADW
jgi:hypothetical protein